MVVATHTTTALGTMEMGSTSPSAPPWGVGYSTCAPPAESAAAGADKRAGAGRRPPGRGTSMATDERACVSGGSTTACHRSRATAQTRRLEETRQTVRARSLPPVPGLFPHGSVTGVHHTHPHGAAGSTRQVHAPTEPVSGLADTPGLEARPTRNTAPPHRAARRPACAGDCGGTASRGPGHIQRSCNSQARPPLDRVPFLGDSLT